MAKGGKRIRNIREKVTSEVCTLNEAISFLKANAGCKFDETVEIAMNLGVDPKKSDQNVRGVVSLPAGTGKVPRVAVFARGLLADAATEAGADLVGADDLADKIQAGEINFDVCIASPDMMGVVGRIGKILGPKGLMPNPKLGTVTQNVAAAVKAAKSGQAEYKLDKAGVVHSGIGKASFSESDLESNIKSFVSAVAKARPSALKGNYIKSITLSTTMGVGLKLDPSEVL